jgi:hypothetical protein
MSKIGKSVLKGAKQALAHAKNSKSSPLTKGKLGSQGKEVIKALKEAKARDLTTLPISRKAKNIKSRGAR